MPSTLTVETPVSVGSRVVACGGSIDPEDVMAPLQAASSSFNDAREKRIVRTGNHGRPAGRKEFEHASIA